MRIIHFEKPGYSTYACQDSIKTEGISWKSEFISLIRCNPFFIAWDEAQSNGKSYSIDHAVTGEKEEIVFQIHLADAKIGNQV